MSFGTPHGPRLSALPPRSGEPDEQLAALDLHRIGREIDTGGRALRFAGGEVEPSVVHRAFDYRALDEAVGKLDLLVRAQAVGGEKAIVCGPVERVWAPLVLERGDVFGGY